MPFETVETFAKPCTRRCFDPDLPDRDCPKVEYSFIFGPHCHEREVTVEESSGVATVYAPRRRIRLDVPRTSGPVVTCPQCKTAFRAESRKKAVCPFCGKNLGGEK